MTDLARLSSPQQEHLYFVLGHHSVAFELVFDLVIAYEKSKGSIVEILEIHTGFCLFVDGGGLNTTHWKVERMRRKERKKALTNPCPPNFPTTFNFIIIIVTKHRPCPLLVFFRQLSGLYSLSSRYCPALHVHRLFIYLVSLISFRAICVEKILLDAQSPTPLSAHLSYTLQPHPGHLVRSLMSGLLTCPITVLSSPYSLPPEVETASLNSNQKMINEP